MSFLYELWRKHINAVPSKFKSGGQIYFLPGLALLELLIAAAILFIAVIPVIQGRIESSENLYGAFMRSRASLEASSLFAYLEELGYSSIIDGMETSGTGEVVFRDGQKNVEESIFKGALEQFARKFQLSALEGLKRTVVLSLEENIQSSLPPSILVKIEVTYPSRKRGEGQERSVTLVSALSSTSY